MVKSHPVAFVLVQSINYIHQIIILENLPDIITPFAFWKKATVFGMRSDTDQRSESGPSGNKVFTKDPSRLKFTHGTLCN